MRARNRQRALGAWGVLLFLFVVWGSVALVLWRCF